MKKFLFLSIIVIGMLNNTNAVKTITVSSPNNMLKAEIISDNGFFTYRVLYKDDVVIDYSKLGLILENDDFFSDLKIKKIEKAIKIHDEYQLLNEKKSFCTYDANRQVLKVSNKQNEEMEIIFQVSNDGVAFSYKLNGNGNDIKKINSEKSSFHFPSGTKAWLHPHTNAQTGWCNVEPCYESHYSQDIEAGTPAPEKAGWSFPALFKTNSNWVLITESGVGPTYCGSRLAQFSPDREYFIAFPQAGETTMKDAPVFPQSVLPWQTPWRIIIVGNLGTIVESTLVTDLAYPQQVSNTDFVKPGKASWSWILYKDESVIYDVQKQYIDFASWMGWDYCLIDADWHIKIGYERLQQLIDYAHSKNVGLLIWYNSAGGWNTTQYGPRNLLFDKNKRIEEFEKISKMGIKGIKVDFWGGDGQSMIQYYYDLLADAAKYKLMVNCHGATVPRGWSRTFPNLVSMESVKGFEYITFAQDNADKAPVHCTILPFTRNAVGPMDFTPVNLSEIPNIRRRTSSAFELALSVLFQSGIQHYAESPIGMALQPDYVKQFLQNLPDKWDDIKFIDGYPGKYVIIARKGNNKWYIAGINGSNEDLNVNINLSGLLSNEFSIITDGNNNRTFRTELINNTNNTLKLTIKKNGGFVIF
jgi:hypothetical protein